MLKLLSNNVETCIAGYMSVNNVETPFEQRITESIPFDDTNALDTPRSNWIMCYLRKGRECLQAGQDLCQVCV